jgi:LysR family transcriptional regulator, regulator of abg operon
VAGTRQKATPGDPDRRALSPAHGCAQTIEGAHLECARAGRPGATPEAVLTLQQLRTLLAIVEHGSFRRAARELDVSQAGLTTSLQALEDSLKVQLIVRSAQGISLTEQGRLVYERAQLIDREARQIQRDTERLRGQASEALHVGLGPTPTATLLPLVVPDFHARHPAVRLMLTSGLYEHLEPDLQQGRLELAITAVPENRVAPQLVSIELFRAELVVVARQEHPLAGARSLAELAGMEWVLLGSPGGPGGSVTRYHVDQGLPAPTVAARCESLTQLAALVRGTDWLALVPSVLVRRGLLGAGLVAVPLREEPPSSPNCLVYRREPRISPAAEAFAAMCRSCARAMNLGLR